MNVDLNSSQALLDFDAAIIDLTGLIDFQTNGQLYPPILVRRRNEISEFLTLGRTVVVFVAQFQFEVLLPISGISPVASHGKRMDFKGPSELKEFWSSVKASMEYLAYWKGTYGQTFLCVAEKPEWSVAAWIKYERGHLLLLPWLKWYGNDKHPSYLRECGQFIISLKKLIGQLTPQKSEFFLPSWSSHYGWQREGKLRSELNSLHRQNEELLREINIKSQELEVENKLKILFTAKGDVLADAVIEVFRQLGTKAEPGEPGRDDIIVEFDGKNAVVEVKGKKGSAAEADAAQLEKWVAGANEEKGINPKGILVVNAFCETPLLERTEPAFPHQMLKYSERREHCLLTTTQLLGLLLEARANPEKRVDLVNSLFSTVGVYPQFSDARTFLSAPSATS